MMVVKCIDRIRDRNNRIVEYRLRNKDGEIKAIKPEILKKAIIDKQLKVYNINLASDDRLIYCERKKIEITPDILFRVRDNKKLRFERLSDYTDFETFKRKASMIGTDRLNDYKDIVSYDTGDETVVASNVDMTLPSSCRFLFSHKDLTCLDISGLDLSNVINASYMFYDIRVNSLKLGNVDTSNIENMGSMFASFEADELNLSGLDFSKVTNMQGMFIGSKIKKLTLGHLELPEVVNMSNMFYSSRIDEVDVDGIDAPKIEYIKTLSQNFSGDAMLGKKINIRNLEHTVVRNRMKRRELERQIKYNANS